MALEIKQSPRLAQQLVITPQLQQAIKLLQLTRMELVDLIQEEMNENPLLEESEPSEEMDASPQEANAQEQTVEESAKEKTEEVKGEGEGQDDFDWDSYLENLNVSPYPTARDTDDRPSFENFLARKTDLSDHLMWQLRLSSLDERGKDIGRFVIGNLDENGYLGMSVEEIITHLGCDSDKVEEVLREIRLFDPVGVGARDLRECLLSQIDTMAQPDPIAREIVLNHLSHLKNRNYGQIAKKLGVSVNTVMEAIRLISELEPKPGRAYTGEEVQNIIPDVFVYKIEGEYVVVLNEDEMPRLRINSTYRNILSTSTGTPEADRKYIQDRLRSALWLLKSIHQRQRTIYRVTKSIVQLQREFLDKGVNYLRPMVLRDVAEDIQMHESTISRATNNKYVHTPQGIFELKYFFNNSISSFRGEDFASESVKNLIKDIIAKENPRKPYSDEKIVHMLRGMNIDIARRTVAKYRESLRILSSNERKRLL
ncbi:MAG: RNA polymerase factor sigma-54 [Proteobacteria bacterium]|nr:RNA polymerase factor sigma-54 [Pseudomonadota bacterium]